MARRPPARRSPLRCSKSCASLSNCPISSIVSFVLRLSPSSVSGVADLRRARKKMNMNAARPVEQQIDSTISIPFIELSSLGCETCICIEAGGSATGDTARG
ncbi:MAG: hypothetical protein LC747_00630 [Acidobacteria bacterium]|nr:hypothetical protein [Acidobacteriota bacterium]